MMGGMVEWSCQADSRPGAAKSVQERLLQTDLKAKQEKLRGILTGIDGAVVAYSGGVDSTLLLKAAIDVLGERALAVTAESETYPQREGEEAVRLAKEMGARHRLIHTSELEIEHFADNPPDRCFHCKKELFGELLAIAREEGLEAVLDGSNEDDLGDHRPGMEAAAQLGVRSPLREAGLTKDDVREISKELGLSTWNKPSFACLASRFPYGDRITAEKLVRVGAAEEFVRGLGVAQVRVRDHGQTARIEVSGEDFDTVTQLDNRRRIAAELHRLGYLYVTVDLEGYRTGSMNAPLRLKETSEESG
jgi:uncharacterized protein